ncbi:MAG: OmpA family protein [Clostridiaceae bacterium]|nr:OmpA family protein [Clostridiaceae bacterium]
MNFLFKSGSSELDNKSVKDLERLVNFLYRSKYLDYKVVLIGYSDNIGDYYSNIQLSENRALVVKDRMIDLFKALDGRVEVLGMGPEIPIATNETLEGREKNRRVEVYIVKK